MAEPLKFMFSDEKLRSLAKHIESEYKDFDRVKFLTKFKSDEWKSAELKARVRFIAAAMHDCISLKYEDALTVLIPVSERVAAGYFSIFFPDFVEQFGQEHWQASMNALSEFTKTSSAEFAIRPFIVKYPDKTMKQMLKWSSHKNVHIRRLSSEGCRPRLPWGLRLNNFVVNPEPVIEILEKLKSDPELYVRKSVANNLNDISKDHPELVIELAKSWFGKSDETDWIVRHALRTLLKQGNKKALSIFGHHDAKGIEVRNLKLDKKKLRIGETLAFRFEVHNTKTKSQETRIEFAVDYRKANGSASRKVFQISRTTLSSGLTSFNRTQRFTDFTTRKHYPGDHAIHILVNGEVKSTEKFQLV